MITGILLLGRMNPKGSLMGGKQFLRELKLVSRGTHSIYESYTLISFVSGETDFAGFSSITKILPILKIQSLWKREQRGNYRYFK